MNQESPIDPESRQKLNEVRLQLWIGGGIGMFNGVVVALGALLATYQVPAFKKYRTRNNVVAGTMLSVCLGSFIGATAFGKNSIHNIDDVFRKGAKPGSVYQETIRKNEREVIESMDEAFARREAAIRKARELREASQRFK